MKKSKNNWIGSSVKKPGSLTAAAKRHGLSKKAEADRESKSSNPKIRSRGNLGKRFLGTAAHGNIRKPHPKKKARKRYARKA